MATDLPQITRAIGVPCPCGPLGPLGAPGALPSLFFLQLLSIFLVFLRFCGFLKNSKFLKISVPVQSGSGSGRFRFTAVRVQNSPVRTGSVRFTAILVYPPEGSLSWGRPSQAITWATLDSTQHLGGKPGVQDPLDHCNVCATRRRR